MRADAASARVSNLNYSQFLRYFGASVVALGADMGVFFALLALGSSAGSAAAVSYSIGIIVHWLVSSRAVFDNVAHDPRERSRQKALFVGTALIGLALTTMIVSIGAHAGFDPRLAKLLAIAASFITTWLLRRWIVFV